MLTPLATSDEVASAELATAAPLSDLLAATQYLVDFTLPADGLSTAVADSKVFVQINDAHAPLLAAITALPASVHSLALLLEELLPAGSPPAVLDHLTLGISSGSVVETDPPPTLTLGAYSSADNSVAYTGTLSPANAFSSSDTSVATIDATTGAITLQGPGTTTITRTAGGKTVIVTLTVTAETLTSTPSSLSGTAGNSAAALVITDQNGSDVTAGCTYASSDDTIATVDSSGVVAYVAGGSATITATHTATGETCTVAVTVSASASYASPLFRDDMAYANKTALLANVGVGKLYDSANEVPDEAALDIDRSTEGQFSGFSSVRYDFLPTTTRDVAPNLSNHLSAEYDSLWARLRVKFKPGFSTEGVAAADNSQAYKLHEYVFGGGTYFGSGRLEITNTSQYDNYYTVYQGAGPTTIVAPNDPGRNILDEWTGGEWQDYVCLTVKSEDGKTRTTKWWQSMSGTTPELISTTGAPMSDGGITPPITDWVHGANFNQARNSTVSLYRGPWDMHDASVYQNPYNVLAADIADVLPLLGTDSSKAAPVVAPAAPGAPIASNATAASARTLAFPVTLGASGELPFGLACRYSTDNGATWSDAPAIAVLSAVLGGSLSAVVLGLAKSTSYSVQFAAMNAGGTSAWTASVAGTTAMSDPPAYTTGLVLDLDASQSADVSVDGAGVGVLTDLSPSNINFTQATSGAKPTLVLNVANGLPIIRFVSGKYMIPPAFNSALASSSTTIFLVASAATSSSVERMIFDNSVSHPTGGGWTAFIAKASGADAPRFSTANFGSAGGAPRGTTLHVMILVLTPSNWVVYRDGNTPFDGSSASYAPNTAVAAALGTLASSIGSATGEFDFARLLVYNTALDATAIGTVVDGLRSQWGTP